MLYFPGLPVSKPSVAKKLGRPRDVDSTETRNRLIDVARRIFARDGRFVASVAQEGLIRVLGKPES